MTWLLPGLDGLAGNLAVREGMSAAVRAGRLFPAYLFHGPSGVGKRAVAMAVARALLCNRGGCGECDDCAAVDENRHGDLHRVAAAEGKMLVSIDQVQELSAAIQLRPWSAAVKVALVEDSHLISEDAASALLKVLEEPPCHAHFFLLEEAAFLPPTVRSRCCEVAFSAVGEGEIARVLEKRGVEAARAALAARLAGGSVGRALDLVMEDTLERENEILETYLGDPPLTLEGSEGVYSSLKGESGSAGETRERLAARIGVILAATVDGLVRADGGSNWSRRLAERCDPPALERLCLSLLDLEDDLRRNVNPQILHDMLVYEVSTTLKKSRD